MPNTIELATKMCGELDKAIVQKAVTGHMVDNNLRAKFIGAKTVQIPEMDLSGLGDYDRDEGYATGTVGVSCTEYTLKMDRGRSFQLDKETADESGVADLAGQIMGEFLRTQVAPELDAYTLSGLHKTAEGKGNVTAATLGTLEADCYKLFNTALMNAQAEYGFGDTEMVAYINPTFWAALNNSTAFMRQIVNSDFKKGEVNTHVKSINGCTLLPVSAARMKTEYLFNNGTAEDQLSGGFTPAEGAKNIAFLLLPKSVGGLIKKTEVPRIFSPTVYQKANAWKIDYRIYYDVLIKNRDKGLIFSCTLD